jgi:hypothetical protein
MKPEPRLVAAIKFGRLYAQTIPPIAGRPYLASIDTEVIAFEGMRFVDGQSDTNWHFRQAIVWQSVEEVPEYSRIVETLGTIRRSELYSERLAATPN